MKQWILTATDCLFGIAKVMPLWMLPALPFVFLGLVSLLLLAWAIEVWQYLYDHSRIVCIVCAAVSFTLLALGDLLASIGLMLSSWIPLGILIGLQWQARKYRHELQNRLDNSVH